MTPGCDEALEADHEKDPSRVPLRTDQSDVLVSASINGPRLNTLLDKEGRPLDGDDDDVIPALETLEEKRLRKRSHYVVYMTCFVMSLGFSIVLTGLWPYMKQLNPDASKEFLGWVVAANPLGQMIASPFFGWCGNKMGSNRVPFVATILMFIVGNILYGLLPVTRPYSDYFIVLSRLIVGVSSANIAICRSYIVSASKLRERTTALSIMAAAQSLGFILGPSIQSGIAAVVTHEQNMTVTSTDDSVHSANGPLINMYNLVAWICVLIASANLFLYLPCLFKEHNISAKESRIPRSNTNSSIARPDYVAIAIIILAFFFTQLCLVLLETILVPMTMDLYAWTPEYAVFIAGIGLGVLAGFAAVWFISTAYLSKRFEERKLLILLGFLPMVLGMFFIFPVGSNYAKIKVCPAELDGTFNTTESKIILNTTESLFDPCLTNCSITDNIVRSRRSITTSGDATCGLGCPSEQEWCYHTPIIEIPQLWLGFFFVFFGYPFSMVLCSTLMSKLLGPLPQGVWMGALTSAGGLSRILGPITVSYIYLNFGTRWMSGVFGTLMLAMSLILVLFYKRLVPMEMDSRVQTASTKF